MEKSRFAYRVQRALSRSTGLPSTYLGAPSKLLKAASKGDPYARYRLGCLYAEGDEVAADPATACMWWSLAAQSGHVAAMCSLGEAYLNGDGVPRSHGRGFFWLSKAARRGDREAARVIAISYYSGDRLPSRPEMAIKWLHQAIYLGCGHSLAILGHCYHRGFAVEKSVVSAHACYIASAIRSGVDVGLLQARMVEEGMNEEQITLAQNLGKMFSRSQWRFPTTA